MLCKGQMIKITASCGMWMMKKSEVSVTVMIGYSHCHIPQHRIKEAMDISFGYSSPRQTYCQSRSGVAANSVCSHCTSMDHAFLIGDRLGKQAGKGSNSI
ncbi:hypothetical protein TNCV_4238181 [Trichonephila clavipes]|nr:hypothetical protein TNCV_4238181 [Trichonephila clavipes]